MRRIPRSRPGATVSIALAGTALLTLATTLLSRDSNRFGTWACAGTVALAYLLTSRATIHLVVRDVHVNYAPTEFSLLLGALLLPPLPHIGIGFAATAVGSFLRSRRRSSRAKEAAAISGFGRGFEVAAFTCALAIAGWRQNLGANAPIFIGAAWVAMQIPAPLTAIASQRLSDREVDWRRGRRSAAITLVLSFQTMLCALVFALCLLGHFRFVLLFFTLLLLSLATPFRHIVNLLIKGEEFRSVDQFFTLLQTTDSKNLDNALNLAAHAVGAREARLVILQREGLDQSLDSALSIAVGNRTSSSIETLPDLWQEAIESCTIQSKVNDRPARTEAIEDRTQIVCPLLLKGQAVGLLVCLDQRVNRLTEGALSMATRLAQHLSMWLEQDRLLGELRREMIERTREALHDPLTGLLNRRGFNEAWDETIKRGAQQLAVLLIDLDRFKDVNTHLGHAGGDELLVQVAHRLRKSAPPRSAVARLGGDEFAIIVPVSGTRNEIQSQSMTIGRSFRAALEPEHLIANESIVVGGSVGFAMFPDHGNNLTTLLYNADAAMFAAKENPDIGVVAHTEKLFSNGSNVADAYRLRAAIKNRDIKVWYQPIIDMRTYQIAGFEALARWQDGMSVVLPSEFISLAERSGHIHSLTELVINDAFSNTMRWRNQTGLDLHISVNFSPLSISHPQALRAINETLEWTGLPAAAVHIEVTESRMFRDPERALLQLDELKQRGLKISLDDFGTGHSTHEWLMRMSPDEIKIDRMFIRDIHEPRAAGIVEVDVLLASKFDMTVVAEGIETTEQWLRARELGVDYGQGFLIGRPMPVEKVNRWLVEEHLEIHKLFERRSIAG